MKLYLASFFQAENHGPGKLISVSLNKPKVKTDGLFEDFAPSVKISDAYRKEQLVDQVKAGKNFVESYEGQLEAFVAKVQALAKENDLTAMEVLPFQDGDTLASWEREGYTNYRKTLSKYLEKLGYKVELH